MLILDVARGQENVAPLAPYFHAEYLTLRSTLENAILKDCPSKDPI